jgi:hypothetical protein
MKITLTPASPPAAPDPSLLGTLKPEEVRCRAAGSWFAFDAKKKLWELGDKKPLKLKLQSVAVRWDEEAMVGMVSTKRVLELAPTGETLREVELSKRADMTFLISSFHGGYVLSGVSGDLHVFDDQGQLMGTRVGGLHTAPLPGGKRFVASDHRGLHVYDPANVKDALASDAGFANAFVVFRDGALHVRSERQEWFTAQTED